jgi:hypothetical protein
MLWQSASFLIQRNRDKLSTRKFDVGVFTQPGPEADIASRSLPGAMTCVTTSRTGGFVVFVPPVILLTQSAKYGARFAG